MKNTLHDHSIVIDALETSNWDRELFEELYEGGITCVHITCAIWEGTKKTLENIGDWYRIIRENSDILLLVTTVEDILLAKSSRKVGVMLGFQNSSPIDSDLSLIEIFYNLGIRIIQLTYNNQNLIASGCYEENDSGLSRFGKNAVRELNRLGMLIDLSHVGERSSLDVIEMSEQPVAITHANPYSFHPSKRNKNDKILKALGESGGVLGFSLYPHLLGGNDISLKEFCEMVARTVDLIGVDHVGIGSDLVRKCTQEYLNWMRMGRWTHTIDYGAGSESDQGWPTWPSWFQSPLDFRNITSGLLDYGFSKSEVALIIGGNWLRLFRQVFKDSSKEASFNYYFSK